MAARSLTASHRAVSLASYRQRRDHATIALKEARDTPAADARASAEQAALQAMAAAEERIAALEEVVV